MRSGHKPQAPRCTLERFIPDRINVEEVKREGWTDHAILVVHRDEPKLTRIERQVVMAIGRRLYGRA